MKFINMMMISLLVTSFAHTAQAVLIDEEWDGFSVPDVIASGFTHNIYQLPLEGASYYNPLSWSGHYWPSKLGGIANRWADSRYAKSYPRTTLPSRNEIYRMSQNDLALLSPAEKYDIAMGNYDFPLTRETLSKTSPQAEEWEGICHGWAPASINHPEPRLTSLRNSDNIVVPFGSADVKALLSYYYANANSGTTQIGLRCNFGQWTGGKRECTEDLNAGAFHIVMTNMLAIKHETFIMDVDRWKEVWNQPIIGYRSRIMSDWLRPSSGAATRAVSELRITTELWYVSEGVASWNPDFGTENQIYEKTEYTYRVEVDANGMIVGGVWESAERPDFIWNMKRIPSFTGTLSGLSYLIRQ
jgi:hypothetical protein